MKFEVELPEENFQFFIDLLKKLNGNIITVNKGVNINQFGLSLREKEIASLAVFSNKEIADKLFLSTFTIGTHLQNIQRKLGVKNKKELICMLASNNT